MRILWKPSQPEDQVTSRTRRAASMNLAAMILLLTVSCSPQAAPVTPTTLPAATTQALPTSTPEPTETPTPRLTDMPSPTASPTPSVDILKDLPYLPNALPSQELDLYLPDGSQIKYPVVLMLHGGGEDKARLTAQAGRFARLGYVVASANYRDTLNTPYPAAVEDTFCALSWLQANADAYRLDPEHIFVMGYSAGGTLAAMLGVVDDPALYRQACPPAVAAPGIAGVITFSGIFDYPAAASVSSFLRTYINNYVGAEWQVNSAIWDQASPITWVDGQEPPFLIIHGAADRNIPARQSEAFAASLQAAGVPVELLLVPNADHAEILRDEASLLALEAFLAKQLER